MLMTDILSGAELPDKASEVCREALSNSSRSFLGRTQHELLKEQLLNSTSKFKIVANQLPINQLHGLPYDRYSRLPPVP